MNSMLGFRGQGASPTMAGGLNNATGTFRNKIPKGYTEGRIQNFSPEQMQLFQQLFSQVSPESYLSRLSSGDQELFDEMEEPALQQFSGLLGNIGSRFSQGGGGAGALSSRRSSGFQNATTSAASNFAQQLQANRQALQRQAIEDLMGLGRDLLQQRPYENFVAQTPQKQYRPSTADQLIGAGGSFLGGIGKSAGDLLGKWLGF